MSLKKKAPMEKPHAIFEGYDTHAGWEWRILKTYQKPAKEQENQYARWMVAATSPFMHGGGYEQGDTYVRDIVCSALLVAATPEFVEAYGLVGDNEDLKKKQGTGLMSPAQYIKAKAASAA
jgi:hypothetical protein